MAKKRIQGVLHNKEGGAPDEGGGEEHGLGQHAHGFGGQRDQLLRSKDRGFCRRTAAFLTILQPSGPCQPGGKVGPKIFFRPGAELFPLKYVYIKGYCVKKFLR